MRQGTSKARKKRSAPRVYRFNARLDEDQKFLIQRAAERTIQERAMLILSARATEAFVAAILNPAEPGPALRAAARDYKKSVGPRSVWSPRR